MNGSMRDLRGSFQPRRRKISNVYVSGARIEEIYGFGPLSGAAANITLFSYRGNFGIAVNTDRAAVRDPDVFLDCMRQGMEEVVKVGKGRKRNTVPLP